MQDIGGAVLPDTQNGTACTIIDNGRLSGGAGVVQDGDVIAVCLGGALVSGVDLGKVALLILAHLQVSG